MKAITLTALFIAAMATANISSAATTHEPSVKTAHTGTQLNNDDQDEELRDTGELYPGLGLFKVRWPGTAPNKKKPGTSGLFYAQSYELLNDP